MEGYEFVLTLPNKEGKKQKYICSFDIHVGDEVFPNMSNIDIHWRDKNHLFDMSDPHILERVDEFDEIWGETRAVTSRGYGRKSNYFKIVRPL